MYFPKDLVKSLCKNVVIVDNTPEQHMNPNYTQLQSILSLLSPFIASNFFGGGQAAGTSEQKVVNKGEVKEEQKEVKKEV